MIREDSDIEIRINKELSEKEEKTSMIPEDEPGLVKASSWGIVDPTERKKFNDLALSANPETSVFLSNRIKKNKEPVNYVRRSDQPLEDFVKGPIRRTCRICEMNPPAGKLFQCCHQAFCR